jgi:tetratricopeptide (TPR) repeat protein
MKYFVLLFFPLIIFSQEKSVLSNSQYVLLQEKVKLQIKNNLDSAFYYSNEIERSNNDLHKIFAKSYKSYYFQLKGDTLLSNSEMKEASLLLSRQKSGVEKDRLLAHVYNLSGIIFKKRGRFSNALEQYKRGKIISNRLNDQKQLIKFNNNIASINSEIGNFSHSIESLKENNEIVDKIEYLYTKPEYLSTKSLINYSLANNFEKLYLKGHHTKYLDSAFRYLKKTLLYTDSFTSFKIRVNIDLGTIEKIKNNLEEAEKYYNSANIISKDGEFVYERCISKYNLGDLYYLQKKYNQALICFKEVDSLHSGSNLNVEEYILSNYYQAKIYNILGDNDKVIHHSNISRQGYIENQKNKIQESLKINHEINGEQIISEVATLKKNAEFKNAMTVTIWVILSICFIGLIVFLIKAIRQKKKANIKVEELLKEFEGREEERQTKPTPNLSIDDEKEREILEKLLLLQESKYFLNINFNQQNVAKKIKTNTTYLSYVVNKNYKKSFSEYSNELKINYAIQELIDNPVYRKY